MSMLVLIQGCEGCDFQNILRVVLWGLPPTFCSLVQRSGRAGRNPDDNAESICIVPKSVMQEDFEEAVRETQESVGTNVVEAEALDRELTDQELSQVEEILDGEGIRVPGLSDSDEDQAAPIVSTSKSKQKKKTGRFKDTNITEIRSLLSYVRTQECRRIPWNKHFKNDTKRECLLQMILGLPSYQILTKFW